MARLRLVFRANARRDLAGILRYVAVNTDVSTASRYNLRLTRECEKLLKAPGMGKFYARKPGVRKINVGPYKIYSLSGRIPRRSCGVQSVAAVYDRRR